ncbi:hypothetical protein [Desulfosporosinus youngiae]|uniref:Uncharacterized protein n=1 Tax=Desulfosporosinus youngiae DSM 17734 TaxID=768710 RepID=H5XUW1_9FIRM|nr:hypothetical protein [Desulfosporosinus youngiae]EHQ89413.1 hypothetical protein DesyoDRAFT_2332 [Desulfosporosinus youngiae DSM 17734]
MVNWWIIGGIAIIVIGWTWYRGNNMIKSRESLICEITRVGNINAKDIYYLSYHGGVPAIPKPQKLNIAIANQYILLFNDKGDNEKIYFRSFRKIDKLTTRKGPNLKGKSIVLWGPFVGLFLQVKLRYFIIIEYLDSNNQNNNILFECDLKGHKDLYDKIYGYYNKAKNEPNPRIGAWATW